MLGSCILISGVNAILRCVRGNSVLNAAGSIIRHGGVFDESVVPTNTTCTAAKLCNINLEYCKLS
jgi:hypothetical protein